MKKVGVIFDFQMVEHDSLGHPHPEQPARLHKLIDYLLEVFEQKGSLELISQVEPCNDQDILLVHSTNYLSMLKNFQFSNNKDLSWYLDSYFMRDTLHSSYLAVGAVISGLNLILQGKWGCGMALVRPPGHHMGFIERPNGFCVFNNIAIAARFLKKKVVIFDWDVHHGDGTQEIFYDCKEVLFISLHRYDHATYYPANVCADSQNVGEGAAKGFNINIAWNLLPGQTARTDDYIYVFERVLAPIIETFSPDFVLISAGFDSAKGDPLGGLELGNEGYAYMTKRLLQMAKQNQVFAVLEGGYNLKSLSEGVYAVIETMTSFFEKNEKNENQNENDELFASSVIPNEVGFNACEHALDVLSEYWPVLRTHEKALRIEKRIRENLQILKQKQNNPDKKIVLSGGHVENFLILKDKIRKITTVRENEFYLDLYSENSKNFPAKDQETFKTFLPKYFSSEENPNSVNAPIIYLENLLCNKENASLLDIKIGSKGLVHCTKPKKLLVELAKSRVSTSEELGFRVVGMVLKGENGDVCFKSKKRECQHNITKDNIKNFLEKFFNVNGNAKSLHKESLRFFIDYMDNLIRFFQEKCKVRFSSVSLFFMLDPFKNLYDIKLIDFSYWEKCEQIDTNIMNGIGNLKKMFQEILFEKKD